MRPAGPPPAARRRPGRPRPVRELLLVAALWLIYSSGRFAADGHVAAAMANADRVWDLERLLRLPGERGVQELLGTGHLVAAANSYYAFVHFPATAALLLWVYLRRPGAYRRVRTTFALLTGAALAVHLIFPLAPPRMLAGTGLVDTGRRYGPAVYGPPDADDLANQYAAMPSLHVGWALLVALTLIALTRGRRRALWLLHPALTLLVVVGTANHYWLDALVAVALVAAAGAATGLARAGRTRPHYPGRVASVRETVAAVLSGRIGYEDGLDRLTVAPATEVDPVLTAALFDASARLFRDGWQPAELHRVVARRGDPAQAHLITDAVAAYLRGFKPRAVDPRWLAQAGELDARVWWGTDDEYAGQVTRRRRTDRIALIDAFLGALRVLASLPPIEVLVPPPGRVARTHRAAGNEAMLHRVRALLAKAEATTFPAEAEAFSAKAQELISRHSLDEALVGAGDTAVTPYARRLGVDHPYESEKASLLDAVARANRCQVVWSPEFGFATVFGFDADIDAVDLLHASLLVQAHRAMARAEPPGGKAGRARLKTFRQSFLIGYAVRIGERLAAADRAALAGAEDAAALLPVLASRETQVREARERAFPRTVRGRGFKVDSEEGWESGRTAADRATLH
ncbi:phosphatase PAP2 family protein [Pseudosporangium ferrugineum]|uniref:Uncharacterized protein DUF2786 n=1 Tax=Pseudosporangium ferrugineum TaxID=439699 RepID=A0A2T0SJG3_9ACTN|nr:phosphatase PAP2 family protein [Pseudosporangium ferrugineum]PRY33557.1 uncharacterized protein DUF2786 [Pseudosporangium ferrugineum]